MKRALVFIALLVASIALLTNLRRPFLPRQRISNGEFRVLQVTYGCGDANMHNYDRSPKASFWIWNHTPSLTHGLIPAPREGLSGSGHSECAISIWWGWFNDKTGLPELGSAEKGIVVTDSGDRIVIPRILPADELRQMFVSNSPRYSRRLRFSLSVDGHPVEFTIANPAYSPSGDHVR
jgi:hypothetical protein